MPNNNKIIIGLLLSNVLAFVVAMNFYDEVVRLRKIEMKAEESLLLVSRLMFNLYRAQHFYEECQQQTYQRPQKRRLICQEYAYEISALAGLLMTYQGIGDKAKDKADRLYFRDDRGSIDKEAEQHLDALKPLLKADLNKFATPFGFYVTEDFRLLY
jgi:hypothetical protein